MIVVDSVLEAFDNKDGPFLHFQGIPKPKPAKEDEASLPPLPVLPDFFNSKRFLLFGQFDNASRKQLNRYIIGKNSVYLDLLLFSYEPRLF